MIILAPLLVMPLQGSPSGSLEKLAGIIAEKTAERRSQASEAWDTHGQKWLTGGNEASLDALLIISPEIQGPTFEALARTFAEQTDPKYLYHNPTILSRYIHLLENSMNPAGANLLVGFLSQFPDNTKNIALRASANCGSTAAIDLAESWTTSKKPDLASEGLRILLLHGPPEKIAHKLEDAQAADLPPGNFATILEALAKRKLPPDFELPLRLLRSTDFPIAGGIIAILEAHPDNRAEDFLLNIFLELDSPMEMRYRTLAIFEDNAKDFRWRKGERRLSEFLRKDAKGELAENVAWTLHRIGNREGSKYLLAELKEEAEANPRDWRIQLGYARRLVDLESFSDAYKIYRFQFERLEKTPEIFRVNNSDWLWAARAAAGARRPADAGKWLGRARMSPSELRSYRDLPEFEPYLAKQPFKRLFGIR
ncbi:MAG TPA: hypothetical protein DDW23_05585 [Planctomycetes bacterium]|nr:hypothetical protein [Planctomycetota bacterium]